VQRSLLHRQALSEALTWLEIHGDRPDVVEHWRLLQNEPRSADDVDGNTAHPRPRRRRRRRRRTHHATEG
jgi:hypothetical protein